jgi:hypothetical protein
MNNACATEKSRTFFVVKEKNQWGWPCDEEKRFFLPKIGPTPWLNPGQNTKNFAIFYFSRKRL